MKLSEVGFSDFKKLAAYICTLCGYSNQSDDKIEITLSFLREIHGYSNVKDLQDAYIALAAGRLDEKHEMIKSFTGMTASRVLQSYLRTKKNSMEADAQVDADRSYVNDENKVLIFKRFNHSVMYRDELSKAEEDYLMECWLNECRKTYKEVKKVELLTVGSFDYYERNGILRVKDGMFQHFANNVYNDICPWSEIEDGGRMVKYNHEMALQKANQDKGMVRMKLNPTMVNLSDSVKRFAVSVYFDVII